MDPVPDGTFLLMSEVRRRLRELLAETPQYAEQNFFDLAAMCSMNVDQELGAYEFTSDGSTSYMVFDHGTRYTTSIRPSQVPDDKIIRIEKSPATDALWKQLQERASALKELSSDIYKVSRTEESIDSVAFLYTPESKGPHYRHIDAVKDFGGFLELKGDDAIRSWCNACRARLVECYARYLLAGNELIEPIATLLLFDYCPFPLEKLLEMNRNHLRQEVGETFMGAKVSMPFPAPDIRWYLVQEFVPANVAVVWGTAVARVFQETAESCRDQARTMYTTEQFFGGIYMALLYYRCALHAFRTVLSLSKARLVTSDRAKTRLSEAATEAVICEEYRAVIESSLNTSTKGFASGLLLIPSIANAKEFIAWLEWMISPSSPVDAEFEIRQAYDAQLIMPTFLRDLALGRIACSKGETKKGVAKLEAAAKGLEKNLTQAVGLGDPNYLSYTYEVMAKAYEEIGMTAESTECARRAEPEYYRALLA